MRSMGSNSVKGSSLCAWLTHPYFSITIGKGESIYEDLRVFTERHVFFSCVFDRYGIKGKEIGKQKNWKPNLPFYPWTASIPHWSNTSWNHRRTLDFGVYLVGEVDGLTYRACLLFFLLNCAWPESGSCIVRKNHCWGHLFVNKCLFTRLFFVILDKHK